MRTVSVLSGMTDLRVAGVVLFDCLLLNISYHSVGHQGQGDHEDPGHVEAGRHLAVGQAEEDQAEAHEAGGSEVHQTVPLALYEDPADEDRDELTAFKDDLEDQSESSLGYRIQNCESGPEWGS